MPKIEFERLARKEARSAYRRYLRNGGPSVALAFSVAFASAITHVESHPLVTAKYDHGTRVRKLKKYPYLLVFVILPTGALRGIALAHTSRNRGYWWKRLP